MFTGLIQAVGRLTQRDTRGGDQRLRFGWGALPAHDIELGESIAVSGCCLTVVAFDGQGFDADVSNESLMTDASDLQVQLDTIARYVERLLATREESA